MRMQWNKQYWFANTIAVVLCLLFATRCWSGDQGGESDFDRIHVVAHQIELLKKRTEQSEHEFAKSQSEQRPILPSLVFSKASKPYLDKASLDVAIAQSNLEGIDIELSDAKQMIYWLEKNVQEVENQINLIGMFKLKNASPKIANVRRLSLDLSYQRRLLRLEKKRLKYLTSLEATLQGILQARKDNYTAINEALKSNKLLQIKQKEVKDELDYQEQQQYWLKHVNALYAKLGKLDPARDQKAYQSVEQEIFFANEKSNYAYTRSLLARYSDQVQQMHLTFIKGGSISLLSEISGQVATLKKQVDRIDDLLKSRVKVVNERASFISDKSIEVSQQIIYKDKLKKISAEYDGLRNRFGHLQDDITELRKGVDHALQKELSARQGLPAFGAKMLLDVGREMLLVPALAFQMSKNLSSRMVKGLQAATVWTWVVFLFIELLVFAFFIGLWRFVQHMLSGEADWHNKLNSKWLILQMLQRHFLDIFLIANAFCIFMFLALPVQSYGFIFSLCLVWLVASGLLTISRLCLLETTHDTTGHDVRLFKRLRLMILAGGVITAFTVFAHQLPLIYELKLLCDRLFLLCLMLASMMVLRSWHVVPNLIVSHMESQHPYIEKCVKTICILVPALIFFNSLAGLLGYMNLVQTLSRYEGIFILVLLGYIILRGLLSDLMVQSSRLIIKYFANGWLWTEAFLKPLDKVLHILLFLSSWAILFLLYGWDKESTIVVRLGRLLHYELINVLGTNITPLNIIGLFVVISVFYWTAKWTREFVYRSLSSRTTDMGVRNSLAILSQYMVITAGIFIVLRVLGIDLRALAVVFSMFAFGIGLGLRDLANNFASGFFLLLERPVKVGDLVNMNGTEGEVIHIGSRAVTVRTWDHVDMLVPNADLFNKSFTNWTSRDDVVRSVLQVKISRHDNPHHVMSIIQGVLASIDDVLREPMPNVYLKDLSDTLMEFEVRYYINIRQVGSLMGVKSHVLMTIWDSFEKVGIKPPYPQSEILIRNEVKQLTSSMTQSLEPQA